MRCHIDSCDPAGGAGASLDTGPECRHHRTRGFDTGCSRNESSLEADLDTEKVLAGTDFLRPCFRFGRMRHHLPDAVTSAHFARLHTVDETPILTRRELLKRVTMVGTAVAIPVRLVPIDGTPVDVAALQGVNAVPAALETLSEPRRRRSRRSPRGSSPPMRTDPARPRRAPRTTSTARSAARWPSPATPTAAGSPPWTPTPAPPRARRSRSSPPPIRTRC